MATMPFGRHRGKPLADLPDDYLGWLLDECHLLRPWLRQEVNLELERRRAAPPAAEVARLLRQAREAARQEAREELREAVREEVRQQFRDALRGWYRRLALDFHPDRGKPDCIMPAINEARDRLLDLLNLN